MAVIGDLTPEQLARLAEYDPLARGLAGDFARLAVKMQSCIDLYNNDVSAIFTLLDDGEVIPKVTGLNDAAEMTDLEHITLQSYFQGIIAFNSAAHRANYVQAAGAANTAG